MERMLVERMRETTLEPGADPDTEPEDSHTAQENSHASTAGLTERLVVWFRLVLIRISISD